jgi:Predicted ring-cleavage extradiol dioxygenase
MRDVLAADTAMEAVTLYVRDLDLMTRYYRDVVTLEVLDVPAPAEVKGPANAAHVTLGRRGVPVVHLRHTPDLPVPGRTEAGLFHTAILFETQSALAAAVANVARLAPGTFAGSADHLVSEAFYFTDPEGNGIELYWDRSRSLWQREDGQIKMDTLYLDPNAYLAQHLTEEGLEDPRGQGGTVVGHVHLQVGDIPTAKAFYVDALGFETTLLWHGALFVSAGGYHHHMAMNVWNSRGAGPRAATLGLGEVAIQVPGQDEVEALRDRLRFHGVTPRDDGRTLSFEDPWRNLIRVTAA